MKRDTHDPAFWRERLARAGGENLHQSVYHCTRAQWEKIAARHREILAATIGPEQSVLDCGCGYGHLLDLMPKEWSGAYLGVDLSPDMVERARFRHPTRLFNVLRFEELGGAVKGTYDWAVLKSIRPMVRRDSGDEAWAGMEAEIRKVAKRLLYLEYDPDDPGSVE